MSDHERIRRLEHCFLGYIAMSTGELQAVTTPEELEIAQRFLAKELEEMRDDL